MKRFPVCHNQISCQSNTSSANTSSPIRHHLRRIVAFVPILLVYFVTGATSPFASAQTANLPTQYTAQFLPPPMDQPELTGTDAYALNKVGQVFGRAVAPGGASRAPVLWTGGIGQTLPVPTGYSWYDDPPYSFINDSGIIVSIVSTPASTGGSLYYPIIWQNGALVSVINVLPSPGCAAYGISNLSITPYGLNKAGDLLLGACSNLFLWTQQGGYQYEPNTTPPIWIPQPAPVTNCGGLQNTILQPGRHLNDADHAALEEWAPITSSLNPCPLPFNPQLEVFTAPSSFTPIPIEADSLQINNSDQILAVCENGAQCNLSAGTGVSYLQFWDGTTIHNIGPGGYASLNNFGQIAFMAGTGTAGTPSIYENGIVSPIPLPSGITNFNYGGTGAPILFNDVGQIAGNVYDSSTGEDQGVVLTPAGVATTSSIAAPSITYGANGAVTVTVTSTGGIASGNVTLTVDAGTPSTQPLVNGSATFTLVGLGAGNHTLSSTYAAQNNFGASNSSGTLTVVAAGLAITASSASTAYGGPVPAIMPTYVGFANGDTAANLTAAPTCTTTASSASPVGTYPTMCSGAVDANYAISYVAGTVTVRPAPLIITASSGSVVYGGAVSAITASFTGFANGQNSSALTTQPTCGTTATSASPAGSQFPSTCGGAAAGNYSISYVSGTVTVVQATTTTTITSQLPNPSVTQQAVTVMFAVTPQFTGIPSGTVMATASSGQSCSSALVLGAGNCQLTFTAAGSPTITAAYSGDGNFLASTSAAVSQTVQVNLTEQKLLVSHLGSSGVLAFDATTGALIGPFVDAATGGLSDARGMAFGPDGNLYVSSAGTNSILRFNGATGAFIDTFVQPTSGGLSEPDGLTFGPDKNLYVVSSGTSNVLQFNGTSGAFMSVFASALLSVTNDLTFGPDSNLYVISQNSGSVIRYNGTTGTLIGTFVQTTSLGGSTALRFGPDGNLYVATRIANAILNFNGATGIPIGTFASGNDLSLPNGIAFGPDSNLYVANLGGNDVLQFDGTTGAFLSTFIASGVGGLSFPKFLLFTAPPNQPPVAAVGVDQTVLAGATVTLNGSASHDFNGAPLTYQWTQVGGPAVTLNLTTAATPTFVAPIVPQAGSTLSFQLIVSDGTQQSAPVVTNVTVKYVNHAPIADAGVNQTVLEGALVTLDGTKSYDPDNDPLTYSWTQTAGPAVTLMNSNAAQPSFTAPTVSSSGGTLMFQLTVSDGQLTATASVSVVDKPVTVPPVANAGQPQTVASGTTVILDGSLSSDPNGYPLTFTWKQMSGPKVVLNLLDPVHPQFVAPTVTSVRQLIFRLVVNDGYLSSSTSSVTITVTPPLNVPLCSLATPSKPRLWPPTHRMVLERIRGVSDPGANPVTIQINQITQDEPTSGLGPGDVPIDGAINPDGTFLLRAERYNVDGRVYQIDFTATNRLGLSCTGAVTVCVPNKARSACTNLGQNFNSLQ